MARHYVVTPQSLATILGYPAPDEVQISPADWVELRKNGRDDLNLVLDKLPIKAGNLAYLLGTKVTVLKEIPEGECTIISDGISQRKCLACNWKHRDSSILGDECMDGECIAERVHSE